MAYRECETHGWLETAEYTVDASGETICPVCEVALSGYYPDVGTPGRSFGGPNHHPRKRWLKAHLLYMVRADHLTTDMDEDDVEAKYPDVEVPA